MAIIYEKDIKTFHLKTKNTSYVIKVLDTNHLSQLYWGKRINTNNLDYLLEKNLWGSFLTNTDNIGTFQLEATAQEYPAYGATDLRSPAIELQFEDGTTATDLRYEGYNIFKGKSPLKGLPATYVENDNESETIEIYLTDKLKSIKVILTYTVFEEFDAITKSVKIINESHSKVNILRALSANVDFKEDDFDFIHLSGAWARERHVVRTTLRQGTQSVESRRGASSHAQNPFMALARKGSDEQKGDVYGFSLVYSGNFLANAEVDMYNKTRAQIGINPFDFKWLLEEGEEFQTPEAVLVYSSEGLTGMSHIYNNLYGKRLCRGQHRDKVRPILINNWEATYFDFNETNIREIAKEASSLGMELFVLDDGWFGKRDDDTTSLGDWFVNEEKIKGGLGKLSKEINEMGLKFGLWFEPEMVSPESELYRKHPDWCIHIPGRNRSTAREQLILDLSREEVCDYIIKTVSDVLDSASISYVKWDMNRNMSEIGSLGLSPERQRETAHRYMLGLYKVLEEITSRFPEVLFESCSGGGGRFDPGMLYYSPQIWCSDDTDAIERLKIQEGTSMVYPLSAIGAHVSDCPNHTVGRTTPFETRGYVALAGTFGYELDVTRIPEEDRDMIPEQIEMYHKYNDLVRSGDYYRIQNFSENNSFDAWSVVSKDKSEVLVTCVQVFERANYHSRRIKLKGLIEEKFYKNEETGEIISGGALMTAGINLTNLHGDFKGKLIHLKLA